MARSNAPFSPPQRARTRAELFPAGSSKCAGEALAAALTTLTVLLLLTAYDLRKTAREPPVVLRRGRVFDPSPSRTLEPQQLP
jgi:hypothetical protein